MLKSLRCPYEWSKGVACVMFICFYLLPSVYYPFVCERKTVTLYSFILRRIETETRYMCQGRLHLFLVLLVCSRWMSE